MVQTSLSSVMAHLRKIDPHLEASEPGFGRVVLFVEPNKIAEISEAVYGIIPIGIVVEYLIHPDYIPESHLVRIEVKRTDPWRTT